MAVQQRHHGFALMFAPLPASFYNNLNISSLNDSNEMETKSMETIYKICYGPINSFYFVYLVEFFPWFVFF